MFNFGVTRCHSRPSSSSTAVAIEHAHLPIIGRGLRPGPPGSLPRTPKGFDHNGHSSETNPSGRPDLHRLTAGIARAGDAAKPSTRVSYYKQVRPIFQAHCQGCHQPAKAGGGYVMTAFDRLLAGGKSKAAAVVPGKPDESHLLDQITPDGGKAEMPKDKPPLSTAELEIIRKWVAQGAVDDTPAPPASGTTRTTRRSTPPAGHRRARLLARRHAAGRRRLPRGPALEGRRLGAGRPPGRPLRADRVGPVLARRHAAGRHRRPARPDGRGPGLGRRQAEADALGPRHLRHGLRRELVARRHEDRLRLRRQHRCGPSTPRRASRSCSWARTTTGCSTRSSRSTART